MFWATRPTIRAAWTMLIWCFATPAVLFFSGANTDAWLVVGCSIAIWAIGWVFVRQLTVLFVFVLAPIYRALNQLLRFWVSAVAFLFVCVAGSGRRTTLVHSKAAKPSWQAVESKRGFLDAAVIREVGVDNEIRATASAVLRVSLVAGVFVLPFLLLLRLLPEQLPAYKPLPPGNYTLD